MNYKLNDIKIRKSPYLSTIGLLAFVPDRWGGTWQVRHQILTRLASVFNVVWFNQPLEWRNYWLSSNARVKRNMPNIYGNMTIYDPGRWLPKVFKPSAIANYLENIRLKKAIGILRSHGCKHLLLYIWRPEFGNVLDLVDYDKAFYHIDDEYSFSSVELGINQSEASLIRRVDQVFIHSPAMMEKKGHLNPNCLYVPNGVDFQAFSTVCSEPEDMQCIPSPRIGYTGVLKEQLDFKLVLGLAKRHPEWSFVLVGPRGNLGKCADDFNTLVELQNVYQLGGKSVDELPAYVQYFDVCMLCYVMNDYTKYIYPLKINEYLAAGKPVVGVPIRSVKLYKDVVHLATSEEEWDRAISDCLLSGDNETSDVLSRQSVAKKFDWNHQTLMIARTMCERLGSEFLRELEAVLKI